MGVDIGSNFNFKMKQNIEIELDSHQTQLNSQSTRINNIITQNPQPSEVVDARGGATVLKDRLDGVDEQLAYLATQYGKVIDALNPPIPLVAIKADNTNDDSTIIQNLLNFIQTTYGAGILELPHNKTMKMTAGITIPAKVMLTGFGKTTILDYSTIGEEVSFTATTVNDSNHFPLLGLSLKGNGIVTTVDTYAELSTTLSTGISVTGNNLNFKHLYIYNFNYGLDLAHSNTYIDTFDYVDVSNCAIDIYLEMATRGATNAGERITFTNSNFFNSELIMSANSTTLDVFFTNCSLDYCNEFMHIENSRVFIKQSHIESALTNTARGWRSKVNYLISTTGSGRLFIDQVDFNLFQIQNIVNPDSYHGSAFVKYRQCVAWFKGSDGTDRTAYSEQDIFFTNGATSVTLYSCFISKIVYPTTLFSANYNNTGKNLTAYISDIDEVNGIMTVTFSAAASGNGFAKVMF